MSNRSPGSLVLLVLATAPAARCTVRVQIADGHVLSTLPAGFASFTMDFHPGSQGREWGQNASILAANLTSPGLIGAAGALAPGVLRLGGSEAGENLTYVGFPGDATQVCPQGYYYCLRRQRWDEILDFARAAGARLMIDLNIIGPGASDD
eukprot:5301505-Prymnesium_polylepis.1